MSKLIFLDIDGTMVGFDGKMPESTREVLNRAVSEGHHLVVSTGRLAAQVYPWLFGKAKFDGFISSSGANVKWMGKNVACRFWSTEQVRRFCEVSESVGAAVFGHIETNLIAKPGAVGRFGQIFVFRDDVVKKTVVELDVVATLLEGDSENLLGFDRRR